MIVKKHIAPDGRLVLVVCDSGLVGKVYSQGELQIDLTSSFYAGDEMEEEPAIRLMKKAFMLHLVGKQSISIAAKYGLVNKESCKNIDNVPFAHVLSE